MEFTNKWFSTQIQYCWNSVVLPIKPKRVLEIGSYEGASTCFLIEKLGAMHDLEIHCVDTWMGGVEHAGTDMSAVEERFLANTKEAIDSVDNQITLNIHKSRSDIALAKMLSDGMTDYFDFVYIDGSHLAPDVLYDAVVGFKLLRPEGVLAFDDYLWRDKYPNNLDPLWSPKIAIDAFTNIHYKQIDIYTAALWQLYVRKRHS